MEFSEEKNLGAKVVFGGELIRVVERIGVVGSSICTSATGVSLIAEGVAACFSCRVHPAAITALLRSALPLVTSVRRCDWVAGPLEEGRKRQLLSSAA